jgi:AbrB family looped-hinge helix DNA binding protein
VDVKTWKKEYEEDCPDSLSFTAVLDDRGRITIPASVRKKLKIKVDSLILTAIKKTSRGEKYEK